MLATTLAQARASRYAAPVDWKEVAKLPEREQMRAWVENWKRVGPELEAIKRRELRALTEEEAFDEAVTLEYFVGG